MHFSYVKISSNHRTIICHSLGGGVTLLFLAYDNVVYCEPTFQVIFRCKFAGSFGIFKEHTKLTILLCRGFDKVPFHLLHGYMSHAF